MHARQSPYQSDRKELLQLLLIGLLSGALYIVYYYAQRAIFLNGRMPDVIDVAVGVPASRTQLVWQVAMYCAVTLALFGLYAWLLLICRRDRLRDMGSRRFALTMPVLFNLGLLFGRPYFSTDVFSYLAHGYLGTLPGSNPYTVPARDVANTAFALKIIPWGWKPETHDVSPYGAIWTHLEIAAVRLTDQVSFQLLFLKVVVVAASLLSAALIWLILGQVRPQDQLLGTLLYLWNPMVIVEFAAEGHNDALMILFTLLAILLAVRGYVSGSLVALTLGILTKFLPILYLPAHLLYFWRTSFSARRSWRRLGIHLVLGAAGSAAVAAILYLPLWAGPATFQGVRGQGQARFIASTSMVLFSSLRQWLPEQDASEWASRTVSTIFGIYVLIASLGVRDAPSLLRSWGRIALIYLLVASPSYWPWYATLPLALMVLSPHGATFWLCIVLSLCSRLVAPLSDITVNGFTTWVVEVWSTTVVGLLLPLFVFGLLSARRRWRQAGSTAPLASA